MKVFAFVLFSISSFASVVFAQESKLATPDSVGTRQADETVRVIGNLPYSNQWTYERPSNYLCLSYGQVGLASQSIRSSNFETQYASPNINIVSLDYFSKITGLADPLGSSFFRKFGLWGRYAIGLGAQSGTLIDDNSGSTPPGEKSSILILKGVLQLNLAYDWSEWVQPYIGFAYKPYYFRNTSSTSAAENEGQAGLYGPALGVQLPVLFSHKATLFGELHQDMAPAGANQVLTTRLEADFGAGFVF